MALGNALQLTNMVRDVAEDKELGRFYWPRYSVEHGALQCAHALEGMSVCVLNDRCFSVLVFRSVCKKYGVDLQSQGDPEAVEG